MWPARQRSRLEDNQLSVITGGVACGVVGLNEITQAKCRSGGGELRKQEIRNNLC